LLEKLKKELDDKATEYYGEKISGKTRRCANFDEDIKEAEKKLAKLWMDHLVAARKSDNDRTRYKDTDKFNEMKDDIQMAEEALSDAKAKKYVYGPKDKDQKKQREDELKESKVGSGVGVEEFQRNCPGISRGI
jgi:hypothetical protein